MKVQDYSQMIRHMTRDKTTDVPGSMAHGLRTGLYDGGRVGFDNGGTSKIQTKTFKYPVKFRNRRTGNIDTVYKDKAYNYSERGKRISDPTLLNKYKTALDDFEKLINDATQSKNVSKLPESFAEFLRNKKLNFSTYYSLVGQDKIPKIIDTNISKIRLDIANDLIKDANQNIKFKNAKTLFDDAGFTSKQYKQLYATGKISRLDGAIDKVNKAFVSLIAPRGTGDATASPKIVDLFNPVEKMSEMTGLNPSIVSKRITKLGLREKSPELFRVFKLLQNPNFKRSMSQNFPDATLTQLMMQRKSFFADYAQSKAAGVRRDRLQKLSKKAGEGVADINTAQKDVVRLLNDHYKKNPEELLGNTKLRNLLDLTLEDGEIVKKNKYVTDDDFKKLIKDKPGLFTMDHVDEVQFEKLSTEFPIFKQLATYNTNSGLIRAMKSYISKNQNSTDPAVQNKIKKQIEFLEDLKLRVDTPIGRVGSKEVLAAVDRKAGVLPNFLAQLRALNIKLPKKAQVALGAIGGLGATTLAQADEVSQRPFPGIKPEGSPTQINPLEEKGLSTGEKVAAGTAGAATLGTKTGRNILGKAFRTLGTRAGAVPLAGYTVYDNLKKGENVVDATLDPLVGAELMLPNLFKENVAKITSNPTLQKLLKVGKYGRMFTPIGAGITAAGLGVDVYKRAKELQAMSPEERAKLAQERDDFSFGEYSGAAEGGIASLNVKK